MSAAGRPPWAGPRAWAGAARLAWAELRARFGWRAFLPFALLLLLAAFLAAVAAVPALAPFVYPLF